MPGRRFAFVLISSFLTLFLGGWVLTSALQSTLGQPQQAKDMLNESGLYAAVIPAQLAEAQKANPALAGIPLDNPEIQKILGNSLDSQKVRTEGDKAVDSIYAWLEGKSREPEIAIRAAPDQKSLATSLGDLAAKHAASLPTCSPSESISSDIATDPLNARCVPIGLSTDSIKNFVIGEVATNPALTGETTLTEDTVTLANGKTITDTFSAAPTWYQRAQKLPLYLAIAAAICAVLLLLLLGLRRGIRSVGKQLFVVGLTLAVCAVLVAWTASWLFETLTPKGLNPNVATALAKLTTLFHEAYRNNIVVFSLYLAAAGAALLLAAFILRRMHRAPAQATPPVAPTPSPDVTAESQPMPAATPGAGKAHPKHHVAKKAAHHRKAKKII